jgi:hypothetical protein
VKSAIQRLRRAVPLPRMAGGLRFETGEGGGGVNSSSSSGLRECLIERWGDSDGRWQ